MQQLICTKLPTLTLAMLRRSSQLACIITCLTLSLQTLAAGGHEGWYQVELIVFARNYPDPQEHSRRNIKLAYPGRWTELKDPAASSPAADLDSTDTTPIGVDLSKEPYYFLPPSERTLNSQANKIERDSRYQLLFHQAWRQVITNQKLARSILIHGGKTYGQHQELEGTIRLSVATYLKLQTNLWFSQFDVNIGQEPSAEWPLIPLRPNFHKLEAPIINLDTNFDETLSFEQALASENHSLEISNANLAATEMDSPAYITRQITLVQQARDMRSDEVHYLDHPVLGVIIKILPYKAPAN